MDKSGSHLFSKKGSVKDIQNYKFTDSDNQIIKGVYAKSLKATLLFIDFSKRKNEANTTSILSPQRNCPHNDDALQKHELKL